ncbi:unnamed protein product [Lactuca virosa]|uniref:Rhomboid-like protein n=1 Tax=Lactuca virosa TaxID=75947 RepID=A0AAU9N1Q6_9ASTR|nr:unnamed protein product [Lactuca virosa]
MSTHGDDLDLLLSLQDRVLETPPSSPSPHSPGNLSSRLIIALGIYILNLLIGFLSPQVDPEFQDLSDDPTLPSRSSDEFCPFFRRLPEFKFW